MLKGGPTSKFKEEATSLERLVSEHSTLQNATQALDGLVQYALPSTIRGCTVHKHLMGHCCLQMQTSARDQDRAAGADSLPPGNERQSGEARWYVPSLGFPVFFFSLWPAINPAGRPSLGRHPAASERHHDKHQGAQVAGSRHRGRLHLHLHLCPPPLLALLSEMTFFMNMSFLYIRIDLLGGAPVRSVVCVCACGPTAT